MSIKFIKSSILIILFQSFLYAANYGELGEIRFLNSENIEEMKEIVKNADTSYDKNLVIDMIDDLKIPSNMIRVVGHYTHASQKLTGFGFFEKEGNAPKIKLFFTASGCRALGFPKILVNFVKNHTNADEVIFTSNSKLGDWVKGYVNGHLSNCTQHPPQLNMTSLEDERNAKLNKLVHQTKISYQNDDSYPAKNIIQDKSFNKQEFLFPSNVAINYLQKVIILTSGLPGAGKNFVVDQLIQILNSNKNYANFDILDVDELFAKHNGNYDEMFEEFNNIKNKALHSGKNVIILSTSQRENAHLNFLEEISELNLSTEYRLVNLNLYADEEIASIRAEERSKQFGQDYGRVIPKDYMTKCRVNIPTNQYNAEMGSKSIPFIECSNNKETEMIRLCSNAESKADQLWREIIGEPSFWINTQLKTLNENQKLALEALIFGLQKI